MLLLLFLFAVVALLVVGEAEDEGVAAQEHEVGGVGVGDLLAFSGVAAHLAQQQAAVEEPPLLVELQRRILDGTLLGLCAAYGSKGTCLMVAAQVEAVFTWLQPAAAEGVGQVGGQLLRGTASWLTSRHN